MSYQMASEELKNGNPTQNPFFSTKSELGSESFFKPLAIDKKMKLACQSPAVGIESQMKNELGNYLDTDFNSVSLHNNSLTHELAASFNAKAFTIGNHVFLGSEFSAMSGRQQKEIVTHELIHTVQQKNHRISNFQNLQHGSESDADEHQAESIATNFSQEKQALQAQLPKNKIPILSTNKALIQCTKAPKPHAFTYGDFGFDAKIKHAEKTGEIAGVEVNIRFKPNDKAPDTGEIRFLQVVRSIDVTGRTTKPGSPLVFSSTYQAGVDRNQMETNRDIDKNIARGFRVDHAPEKVNPRTQANDDVILPYYNEYGHGTTGKKNGADVIEADMWDHPSSINPLKFNFITTAIDVANHIEYGSVIWGFEVYHSGGIAKVKDLYSKFRNRQGPTSEAALSKFNEFYRNP